MKNKSLPAGRVIKPLVFQYALEYKLYGKRGSFVKREDDIRGLTNKEVEKSRAAHGSNQLSARPVRGFWSRFLESFGDPIIKILLISLALNLLFLFRGADWYETAGIALAVFLATFVSALSEYGSESAFEKLREDASRAECRVIREGKTLVIPTAELVVGDMLRIAAGEKVPVDGVLVRGSLKVDQSALNGESREAAKTAGGEFSNDLAAHSALFCGSTVVAGTGVLRVVLVGDATTYGGMAAELGEETRESPLKVRLAGLAKTLSRIGYCAAAAVAAADLFHQIFIDSGGSLPAAWGVVTTPGVILPHLLHAATLAITVIVVAVPEGLPMMITVVLSSNMRRMLKDKVLVRKLVGIETSGSLNILFTDKTGTLTTGRMEVAGVVCGDGSEVLAADAFTLPVWEKFYRHCRYGSAATPSGKGAAGGNPTDRAVLEFVLGRKGGAPASADERIEFDSARKYSAVRLEDGWYLMGAAELLLDGAVRSLDSAGRRVAIPRERLEKALRRHARRGERILALATAENRPGARLSGLCLTGFLVIRDGLRGGVRTAVASMHTAGVQVVMVTGDNKDTAAAIAEEAGLLHGEGVVLTGTELEALSDERVKSLLPRLRVVARARPADKSRLVRLSEELGLVVGMTGDGINDAPALKRADVGFAMGSGTEIAKEAGDIVILDDNFASIARAVLYGRTIFKSIRKFIVFQLTMNFCAVGVSIIAPFIGVESPVTVIQMLWINMIMDTLGGLAFAGEPPLREYMNEPPKRRDEPIINRYMYNQIGCMAVFTVALCIGFLKLPVFARLCSAGTSQTYFMTMFFALFVFAGIFNSFNARTYRMNLLSHLRENRAFLLIMGMVFVVQSLMIRFGGTLFRTEPLSLFHFAVATGLGFLVVPADLLRKRLLRATGRKGTL
ncbi:MAG: calcium-translocating P-type ATPase, PMCA-type [Candidatus Howiella sp.]